MWNLTLFQSKNNCFCMVIKDMYIMVYDLQNKIEKLAYVERCYIHVDHQKRDYLKHKIPVLH